MVNVHFPLYLLLYFLRLLTFHLCGTRWMFFAWCANKLIKLSLNVIMRSGKYVGTCSGYWLCVCIRGPIVTSLCFPCTM